MIRESFIFLDKIRHQSEKNIWSRGVHDWNSFMSKKNLFGISPVRKMFYNQQIMDASRALKNYDSSFFKGMSDTWRLYEYFKDDAVFLDIEAINGNITIIGLFDGVNTKTLVKGFNLNKELLKKELSKYKLVITFNGGSFDLPIIKKYFKDILPAVPHIDLRHVCAAIGLKGGLKMIEKELGLKRENKIVDAIYGGDPALLWRKFLATGDRDFIELLVNYNEEDIINLKPIADYSINRLWEKIRRET